jgi:hypothetical protein
MKRYLLMQDSCRNEVSSPGKAIHSNALARRSRAVFRCFADRVLRKNAFARGLLPRREIPRLPLVARDDDPCRIVSVPGWPERRPLFSVTCVSFSSYGCTGLGSKGQQGRFEFWYCESAVLIQMSKNARPSSRGSPNLGPQSRPDRIFLHRSCHSAGRKTSPCWCKGLGAAGAERIALLLGFAKSGVEGGRAEQRLRNRLRGSKRGS